MKTARILIADDHKEFRTVVAGCLNSLPNVIVVGEAVDGIDAIEKTGRLDPEIVLMDITMPHCTGLEATRIIKERWPLKKVLIGTMHDNPFYRTEAQRAGADGYVLKSSLKCTLQAIIDLSNSFLDGASGSVGNTQQQYNRWDKKLHITDRVHRREQNEKS